MITQMDLNYWEGIMNGGDSDSEGVVLGTEEEDEEENSDAEPDEDDDEELDSACEELVQRVETTFLDILDEMIEEIEDEYDTIGPIPDVSKVLTPTKTTTTTTTVSKESNKTKPKITTSQPPLSSPSAAIARNDLSTLNDSRDEGTQTEGLFTLNKSGEGEEEYGIKPQDDDLMKSARSEIASLRLAKETLVNQRKEISDRLKKGLSENEELDEKRVYEFEEAIEAIDSAIEYKNEFLCGRDITLSNCLAPGKNKANLATRLTNLSKLDLQRLVWNYLSKVVELRYSSKRLEKQVGQHENDYEKMSVMLTRSQRHQHEMQAEYESRIKLITSAVSKNPNANHLNQDLKLLNKQLTHALKKQYDLERSLTELLVRHGYLLNGTDYDVKQVVRMLGIDTEKVGLNWRRGDDEDEEEDKRMSSRAGYNNNNTHHREKSKTRDRRDSIPFPPALPTQGGGIPPEIRSALESGLGTSRRMREREAYNQNHHYYYDEDQDLPSSQFHLQPYQSSRPSSRHRRHHHRHHQPSSQSRYRSSGHHYYESSHHDNNYGGNEGGHRSHHHHAASSPQPPPSAAEVRREKQKLIIQPRNRDF